ncbi:MAG: 2-hydroxyacyl-CoA dehydratase family protein [Syntrophomonadaceae bacterium]|nr:2-hydroxyacyl-CoA dehydratase family protein [Syntrophomonadaceae bacterium]
MTQWSILKEVWKNDTFVADTPVSFVEIKNKQILESYKDFVTSDDICNVAMAYLTKVKNNNYSMAIQSLARKALSILCIFVPNATNIDILRQIRDIVASNKYDREAIHSGDSSLYSLSEFCQKTAVILSEKINELL